MQRAGKDLWYPWYIWLEIIDLQYIHLEIIGAFSWDVDAKNIGINLARRKDLDDTGFCWRWHVIFPKLDIHDDWGICGEYARAAGQGFAEIQGFQGGAEGGHDRIPGIQVWDEQLRYFLYGNLPCIFFWFLMIIHGSQ